MADDQTERERGPVYSEQQARQGEIILRKPWERRVFVAGLVGAIVLAIVLVIAGIRFGQTHGDQHLSDARSQTGLAHN